MSDRNDVRSVPQLGSASGSLIALRAAWEHSPRTLGVRLEGDLFAGDASGARTRVRSA